MRQALRVLKGRRIECSATVIKFGYYFDRGIRQRLKNTILLQYICHTESDRIIAKHCWVKQPSIPIELGDKILFTAKIVAYSKARSNGETYRDYKIGTINRVKVLTKK